MMGSVFLHAIFDDFRLQSSDALFIAALDNFISYPDDLGTASAPY